MPSAPSSSSFAADFAPGVFGLEFAVRAVVLPVEGARWLSMETSVVRRLGDWSLQAGWRQTAAGRETPISGGPVVAVWRRF